MSLRNMEALMTATTGALPAHAEATRGKRSPTEAASTRSVAIAGSTRTTRTR